MPAVLMLILAGCGTTLPVDESDSTAGGGDTASAGSAIKGCVTLGGVKTWQAIDDRRIYVEGQRPGTRYLLTTKAMCRGVLYARVVEFPTDAARICADGRSRVYYRRSDKRKSCGLAMIERVDSRAAATELARSRK